MALIDAVFRRSVTDRIMSFGVIASETKLPINEVEHLVMKALRYTHSLLFSHLTMSIQHATLTAMLTSCLGMYAAWV